MGTERAQSVGDDGRDGIAIRGKLDGGLEQGGEGELAEASVQVAPERQVRPARSPRASPSGVSWYAVLAHHLQGEARRGAAGPVDAG